MIFLKGETNNSWSMSNKYINKNYNKNNFNSLPFLISKNTKKFLEKEKNRRKKIGPPLRVRNDFVDSHFYFFGKSYTQCEDR